MLAHHRCEVSPVTTFTEKGASLQAAHTTSRRRSAGGLVQFSALDGQGSARPPTEGGVPLRLVRQGCLRPESALLHLCCCSSAPETLTRTFLMALQSRRTRSADDHSLSLPSPHGSRMMAPTLGGQIHSRLPTISTHSLTMSGILSTTSYPKRTSSR